MIPLDVWVAARLGLAPQELSREAIARHQREKLRETLRLAKACSPFYRRHLAGVDPEGVRLEELAAIPAVSAGELRREGHRMVCVRQEEIARITTLQTSGTVADAKRLYFTEGDLERTVDFFHHGMANLVGEGDVVLILLPCRRPGSVGELLHRGLLRLGATCVPFGPVPRDDGERDGEVLQIIRGRGVSAVVGGPVETARLAAASGGDAEIRARMRAVLLSTEYVSPGHRHAVARGWGCRVFEHYGMTEMGFGGAVSCGLGAGYHVRENDLLVEVIDPESGAALPDGQVGEIVFTTLTRTGMPLIRYRTGDFSAVLPGPCGCGSPLKRLDRVAPRPHAKRRAGLGGPAADG